MGLIENVADETQPSIKVQPPAEKLDFLELPIHDNVRTTKFEALLMILNYSFRHGLSGVATEDLCKLVNCLLDCECIPTSKYWMKKNFGCVTYNIHFYCASCECYITEISSDQQRTGTFTCPVTTCQKICNIQSLNNGHFFVTLPVREQLKFLLENTDDVKELLQYRWTRKYDCNTIADVYDGTTYSILADSNGILSDKYNLSATACTDGAVVYHSVKNTLWPIHLRINEFPPELRFNQNNSMLAGLYFGTKDPNMSLFLTPFVKEMRDLYINGFEWCPTPSERVKSKVVLLQCVLDSVAKPKVQNSTQFNGYWGCGYCLHPGVVLDTVASNQCKYTMSDDNTLLLEDLSCSYTVSKWVQSHGELQTFPVQDRNDSMIREDMEKAENLRKASSRIRDDISVRGMKGTSVLCILHDFDMAFGFPVDYMHCVLLGVCRTLSGLWFDSDSPFYIGSENLSTVEKNLSLISPPSSISRRPRPLTERLHWKANEWRAWLLYYSLPCVTGSIPGSFLKHYCLLVSASFTLLGDSISKEDVKVASFHLSSFVIDYEKMYSEGNMFYNVHLLLHLGKMVILHGPWWCYSAFSFEHANGCLIKLVQGTRGVASQIAEKYSMCKLVPKTISLYTVSERVVKFCEELLCYRIGKVTKKIGSVRVFGSQKYVELQDEERQAFYRAGIEPTDYSFERFIKQGIVYHARCYSRRGEKSDDSVVRLKSESFGVIERIVMRADATAAAANNDYDDVITDQTTVCHVLLRMLNVDRNRAIVTNGQAKAEHIKCCRFIVFGDLVLINVEDIVCKSILLRCSENTFIADFPNTYEKD